MIVCWMFDFSSNMLDYMEEVLFDVLGEFLCLDECYIGLKYF